MPTTITVMGAGGKMGCRIVDQLGGVSSYNLRCVEPSTEGHERLSERGLSPMSQDEALPGADVVILAVPDTVISDLTEEIVPHLDAGTVIFLLDPAAAHAGVLHERDDVTYFISHPCHPQLFATETDREAQADLFGGRGLAEQNIVCALEQGPESDYDVGESIARDIYAPVDEAHRLTTEQMAILEPALGETLTATCLTIIREGLDTAVEMGVPEAAARDFVLGHLRIESAILFDEVEYPLSDGAQQIVREAKDDIFREDWDTIFEPAYVEASTASITDKES